MGSRWVHRAALLALAAGTAATPAAAQRSTTRGFNIGANLQGASLTVEDNNPAAGGGFGVRAGYGFNRSFMGYIETDGIVFHAENPELEGEWTMAHVDLGVRYNFANSLRRWVPFLDGAIGVRAVSVADAAREGEDVGTVTFSGGALSLGGGLSFFATETFAIETLVKLTGGRFEQVDVGNVSVRDFDIEASSFRFKVGVSWWP